MNVKIIYTESKNIENNSNFFTWDEETSNYVKETYKNTGKIISENITYNTSSINNIQIYERTVIRVFSDPQYLLEFNQDQKISDHRKLKNTYNLNNQISTKTEKIFID